MGAGEKTFEGGEEKGEHAHHEDRAITDVRDVAGYGKERCQARSRSPGRVRDANARLDFSDEVTPFEVAHAAIQADVVDGVVVPFGKDPLVRVVGSGRGGGQLALRGNNPERRSLYVLVVGFDDAVNDGDGSSRYLVDGDVAVGERGRAGHGQEQEVASLQGGSDISAAGLGYR